MDTAMSKTSSSHLFSTFEDVKVHSIRSTVNESDAYFNAIALQTDWPVIPILTALFGILTVCTGASLVILRHRGLNAARLGLLLCILAMYGGTTAYWALTLRSFSINLSSTLTATRMAMAAGTLRAPVVDAEVSISKDPSDAAMGPQDLRMCVGTAALLVNITLGDGIVWWRAWVVCARKTWVLCLAAFLLLSTSAVGITETAETCTSLRSLELTLGAKTYVYAVDGAFFVGNFFGFVSSTVSLATNVAATGIIWYQAWAHSHMVRECHLNLLPSRVGVQALLTLLVESGSLYCVLWAFVEAFQVVLTVAAFGDSRAVSRLSAGFQAHPAYFLFSLYLVDGGLLPLIAIYPTAIIILVTLGNSCFDVAVAAHTHGPDVSLPLFFPSDSTVRASDAPLSPDACPGPLELVGNAGTNSTRTSEG